MSEMREKYKKEIMPALKTQLSIKNSMQVPSLEKIVLSVCMGSAAVKNAKILNTVVDEISSVTGQKAVITKSRKAIANFKLREGMPLGVMVTLRKDKMWTFIERMIHFSLPRVRDFRGLSPKGFDGRGNYNMGIKEQIIFPEVNYDKVEQIHGMNITICTSSKDDAGGKALLEGLGMPFKKN